LSFKTVGALTHQGTFLGSKAAHGAKAPAESRPFFSEQPYPQGLEIGKAAAAAWIARPPLLLPGCRVAR